MQSAGLEVGSTSSPSLIADTPADASLTIGVSMATGSRFSVSFPDASEGSGQVRQGHVIRFNYNFNKNTVRCVCYSCR